MPDPSPEPEREPEPADGDGPKGLTVGRFLAILAAVAIGAFWIWIFISPQKHNPDYLTDRTWANATGTSCTTTKAALHRLPAAQQAKDPVERAATVDEATDLLTKMVDGIEARPLTNPTDARIVKAWIADWRVYLKDRRDYAKNLRKDRNARFLVRIKPKANDSYDRVLTNFGDANDLPDCDPPLDLA